MIKLAMSAMIVVALATSAWAQSDDVFFSTSNSLSATLTPGNLSVSYSSLGQDTLYVWVTEATGSDISPPDTGITPTVINGTTNYVPNSSAAIGLNYTVTAGTSSVNFNGSGTDGASDMAGSWANSGSATAVSGTDLNGLNRGALWDSVSSFTFAGNPSSVSATAITNVNATVVPTTDGVGNPTGVSRGFALTQANGTTGANNQRSTTNANAFLLGSVTFTASAAGSATIQIQKSDPTAGGVGIFQGATDLSSAYSYFAANINISTGRLGDLNNDGNINATDINLIASDIKNGYTYNFVQTTFGRNDALLGESGATLNNPVAAADFNHEVGTLVDINGGGIGGAHGTHPGDANLDANVDASDLSILRSNLGNSFGTPNWALGDFNGDGNVDASDLSLIRSNLGLSGSDGQFSAVPEPSSFFLLALCGVGGMLVKRRNRK
jgi:hypothetical protein